MSKQASKQTGAESLIETSETPAAQAVVDASRDVNSTWQDPEPSDPDIKLPEPKKDSDYATFRSLRAKDLWITLKPTDMIQVNNASGGVVRVKDNRPGEYPDGPFIAKFSMGTFRTNKKAVIIGMLNAQNFGISFGIDPMDATGYWRRHNVIKERVVQTVQMDVEQDPAAIRLIAGTIGVNDRPQAVGV